MSCTWFIAYSLCGCIQWQWFHVKQHWRRPRCIKHDCCVSDWIDGGYCCVILLLITLMFQTCDEGTHWSAFWLYSIADMMTMMLALHPAKHNEPFAEQRHAALYAKPKCVKRKIRRGAKSCFPSRALATFQVEGVASSLIMSCFFLSSRGVRRAVGSNPPDEPQHLEVNYAFVLTHK